MQAVDSLRAIAQCLDKIPEKTMLSCKAWSVTRLTPLLPAPERVAKLVEGLAGIEGLIDWMASLVFLKKS